MYDPSLLYYDPILTEFSVGWADQTLFGLEVLPETPVNTQSARYNVFDRSSRMIFPSRREPGTVANEIRGRKWSYDSFFTKEHSLQAAIHDEERQQLQSQGGLADPVFGGALQIDPEQDATDLVMQALRLEHELKASTLIRNVANYPAGHTVTLSGAQQWDDYTNGVTSTSNPVGVIQTAIRVIKADSGVDANAMIIPSMGVPWIDNHPRIVDRFKTFSLTDPEAFRLLTGFTGTVYYVDSVYNAANNIDADEDITYFWGHDIWVGRVDRQLSRNQKTFGKTFAQKYLDGTVRPTERWREQNRRSDLVRTSWKYDLKLVSPSTGYLIKNAFSTAAFPG